ncbi:MAG: SMC-Scp complex subunit ScpB [bacterium]|nr:SMC-Scp complex subunit ScpB [bacterium]MDT8396390.1 SMC-Scp complex subunit ScpB [bacterium]
MSKDSDRAVIEALLFASSRPLTVDSLSEASGWNKKLVRDAVEALKGEYEAQGRGFSLEEVAGGYQLRSDPRFADQVRKLFTSRSRRRFTRSSLETVAIVAYRQPVTRAEIEQIRGVDSGAVLKTLLSQVMIRILGRKEAPGRPILYGTTREFLEYFGLRDLESLPTLEEVAELLEEGEDGLDAETRGHGDTEEPESGTVTVKTENSESSPNIENHKSDSDTQTGSNEEEGL